MRDRYSSFLIRLGLMLLMSNATNVIKYVIHRTTLAIIFTFSISSFFDTNQYDFPRECSFPCTTLRRRESKEKQVSNFLRVKVTFKVTYNLLTLPQTSPTIYLCIALKSFFPLASLHLPLCFYPLYFLSNELIVLLRIGSLLLCRIGLPLLKLLFKFFQLLNVLKIRCLKLDNRFSVLQVCYNMEIHS